MAKKDTAGLPDDMANLALSPEAEAALREVTEGAADTAPAVPSEVSARPSAAAKAGIENPNDTHRVGTAAVPGTIKYVYGEASVTVVTN